MNEHIKDIKMLWQILIRIIRCGSVTFKDKEKESDSSAVHGFIPIDDIINDLKL